MADMTMCTNGECPLADACWRFGCPPKPGRQSYQKFEPKFGEDEDFGCDKFIEYPNEKNIEG